MDIEIRKLTPDLVDAYIHFFDTTPHDDHVDDHKCYCVSWCRDDCEGKDLSERETRRNYAIQCVKEASIQGYLAYDGPRIVGWCNANTKSDCLKCSSWQRYMRAVPTEEATPDIRIKSIYCFVIAPEMKRKGIATQFLKRVCQDAAQDGFDFVEAYPNKAFAGESADFMGPLSLYTKEGFSVYHEMEKKYVVRKRLK